MGKRLNIKRVSEVIGDDYKKWRKGDIVKIKAQTGAGKTFFITGNKYIDGLIDYVEEYENILYVCNRIELKRQIKLDLLIKFDMKIEHINNEIDYKWLDNLTQIRNITITSYQAIAEKVLDKKYYNKDYDLSKYSYIICDECHFFLTDANFNNKTYLAFEELIASYLPFTVKILISATINEVDIYIKEATEDLNKSGWNNKVNVYTYETGIDYSYLDINYFKKLKDIIQLIKNDISDEKWLIFVKSKEDGRNIEQELKEKNISVTFIEANISHNEKGNITTNSKFNSKVLISTKVLDNGVNLNDDKLLNLVVMAYDKVTFIQEVGRVRVNILDAKVVKLYIPIFGKRNFKGKLEVLNKKLNKIEIFNKDRRAFNREHSHDAKRVLNDLFYLDKQNNWSINELGLIRLKIDIKFAKDMMNKFKLIPQFAYVFEQLSWLGRFDFYESKIIQYIGDEINMKKLEEFLKEAYENDERFTKEYFIVTAQEIIESDDALRMKFNNLDNRKNRNKGINKFNEFFKELDLDYMVGSRRFKINGKLETKYIVVLVE